MVLGARCGVENCRSRKYEEGEDGYLYCENGHRKGELLAGEDDDMFEGTRSRTRKKEVKEEEEKVYKAYRGAKGVDLYVKCLQLVLRHQLAFLIHKKGLPTELETVVQDLWSLRILELGDKIRSESQELVSSQAFSTQESDTEAERDPLVLHSHEKKIKEPPTLIDTLALCYMGTTTLRLPVTPGDIYIWTTEEDMPYHNAIRLIPPSMKSRLPPTYQSVINPNALLNLRRFYTSLTNLQLGFEKKYSILWPPLNVPVLLFRYLKDLALPLELYDATIRLGEKLGYDFALPLVPGSKFSIATIPEAQLISCLVICVKLIFPFDGTTHHPRSALEPTATAIDWGTWSQLIQEAKAEDRGGRFRYTTEELNKVEEKDVFSMSNDQLDQYLDFYLSNFLNETHLQPNDPSDDFRSALYEMFPVSSGFQNHTQPLSADLLNENKLGLVRGVHGSTEEIRAIPYVEGEKITRPGGEYVEYNMDSLPEHAKQFYEEAARVAGLSLQMLVMCVRYIERKIARERAGKTAP